MDAWTWPALVAAATAGGALNSLAGGGTFLTFPLLAAVGLPAANPVKAANATSTVALWPGSVAAAWGYRGELRHDRRHVAFLAAASALGGIAGALLLLRTPEPTFAALVPWLLLAATLVFAFGRPLARRLRTAPHPSAGARPGAAWAALGLAQFAVAVYGGYFGAGIGILMLAAFAAFGMEDVHAMNGLKAILGSIVNGVAIVAFAAAHLVVWPVALAMAAGSVAGGYLAARNARRIPEKALRAGIIAVGAVLSAVFFWQAHGSR